MGPFSYFSYEGLPSRVIFGVGSVEKLGKGEMERLGAAKALVLSTPQQRELAMEIADRLGMRTAAIFDRAAMHVPIEIAHEARQAARELNADCCVAVGGGSTTGLAKAIALTSPLPILAIPTSYAGSEMTPIWGLTQDGRKSTGRDMRVLPKVVLYDPSLTVSLPAAFSATSGINAIAHCVEARYAKDANPVISMLAEEGIRAMAASLPAIAKEPANLEARSQALYGAWLGGISLGSVGMALHHKLCHTTGRVRSTRLTRRHCTASAWRSHAVAAYNTRGGFGGDDASRKSAGRWLGRRGPLRSGVEAGGSGVS